MPTASAAYCTAWNLKDAGALSDADPDNFGAPCEKNATTPFRARKNAPNSIALSFFPQLEFNIFRTSAKKRASGASGLVPSTHPANVRSSLQAIGALSPQIDCDEEPFAHACTLIVNIVNRKIAEIQFRYIDVTFLTIYG